MRKVLFVVVLLVLAGAGALWYWWVQQKAVEHLKETAARVADVELQAELDVDLSLKGVVLSHGEKGELHWELKAKQANYVQDQGMVEVAEPVITYRVAGGEGMLTVEAPKGAIWQDQERARLWSKVRAVYDQNVLTADELIYDGKQRELKLDGNVTLAGSRFVCHTQRLRYLLQEDRILAENGITATVYVDAEFMQPQGVSSQ